MRTRIAAALAGAATAVALAAPAYAAAPQVTINPTVVHTGPTAPSYVVTGTYRCDPLGTITNGSISVTLRQTVNTTQRSADGVTNATCDGLVHTYSVTVFGSSQISGSATATATIKDPGGGISTTTTAVVVV